jgi:hypothetical protein
MSHELETLAVHAGVAPDRQAAELCRVMSSMTGLKLTSAYEGTLAIGSALASVTLETDLLHARLPLDTAASPWERLAASHNLPTNLRHALVDQQPVVLGDAPLDAQSLAENLQQFAAGFRLALGKRPRASSAAEPLTPEHVEAALRRADIAPEDIVRHEGAWHLHARLAGEATPLVAAIDGQDLVIARKLIALAADDPAHDCVALHALRTNGRLRHCRLAYSAGHVVAEVRLPAALVSGDAIAHCVRGVVIAARHVQPSIEILSRGGDAAALFRRLFVRS